jgi:DNA polymerase-3 subunit delta'
MTETDDLPEPDAVEGAPHPRRAARLFGQEAAEAAFLAAWNAGRLHHAWLISGPRGSGKATLAWRIAAFLLHQEAGPGLFGPAAAASLDTDPDSPLRHRMAALSEPRLHLVRRSQGEKEDKVATVIRVEDVRRMRDFFRLSAADGGRRVVIVDAAEEMNPQAANALLKELEEPPKLATFLMASHQPGALLPTIRSRCRTLHTRALEHGAVAAALDQAGVAVDEADRAALAALAGGSAGFGVRLVNLGGLEMYAGLVALAGSAPGMDRPAAIRLSEGFGGRQNEPRFEMLLTLVDLLLSRLARAGSLGPPAQVTSPAERAVLARLAPSPAAGRVWAGLQQELSARARQGKAVNLDPASLILDTLLRIDEAAKLALR